MTDPDIEILEDPADDDQTLEADLPQASEAVDGSVPNGTLADDEDPNREAAKYRRRLRDTESERDSYRTQLDALHRQLIDMHVTAAGVNTAGFWAGAPDLATMVNDDGTINVEAVNTAIGVVADQLGLSRASRSNPVVGQQAGPPVDPWVEVFKGHR